MGSLDQLDQPSQYQTPPISFNAPTGHHPEATSSNSALGELDKRSFRDSCVRGSQSSASASLKSTGFRRFVDGIPKLAERRKKKAEFVKKLKLSSFPGARAEAGKISQCHTRVYSNGKPGGMTVLGRQCHSRWCPICGAKIRRERRVEVDEVLRIIRLAYPRMRMYATTLTQDPKHLPDNGTDCKTNRRMLQKRFRSFQQTVWCRTKVNGMYFCFEATKKNIYWHWHIHAIVMTELSQKEFTNQLRWKWSKYGFQKVKLFQEKRAGRRVAEFVKYVVKDFELDGEDLGEVIQAAHRRRLSGATGIVKDIMKSKKEQKKSAKERLKDKPVPPPPEAFNRDGEVYQLPEGLYDPEDLYARYIGKGCESSFFALRLYHYRIRHHRKWEAQYQERFEDGKEVFTLQQAKQRLGYWVPFGDSVQNGMVWSISAAKRALTHQ